MVELSTPDGFRAIEGLQVRFLLASNLYFFIFLSKSDFKDRDSVFKVTFFMKYG
ncbi:hypothetical protein CANARDRAFT_145020 [[Candida] arabinofermentans NRRL YB-2248]|uniref:Uncharacterized protein n=1 Tax=[Candida] arabinofermentans NRRL YB-2248 TaxID=983967 RepID=A0A1E4T2E5_9ASCO|nr:hypothetical protein CANARDRAFT_145020 [[Candida] arabinofermentans NRRL YB-2248]